MLKRFVLFFLETGNGSKKKNSFKSGTNLKQRLLIASQLFALEVKWNIKSSCQCTATTMSNYIKQTKQHQQDGASTNKNLTAANIIHVNTNHICICK